MVASDKHKEARIVELNNHPFFIGTLFVPQANSSIEKSHPIVTALLNAMEKHKRVEQGVSN
jgi:CTP synthase (UTP-ammonia lyase)